MRRWLKPTIPDISEELRSQANFGEARARTAASGVVAPEWAVANVSFLAAQRELLAP